MFTRDYVIRYSMPYYYTYVLCMTCTGDSPYILREEDLEAANTTVRVVSFRGMMQVGVVGEAVVNSCKFTGITPPDRMCTCYSTLYRCVYLYSHCTMFILRVEKTVIPCLIFINTDSFTYGVLSIL